MIKEIKNIDEINYFLRKFDNKISNLNNPYSYYFGYYLKKQIIGFIAYSLIYDKAEIEYIFVDKNYRNQNIATELIKKLIEIAQQKECINITLEVRESNEIAIKFYQKLQFEIVAKRKNYYRSEDALLMIRELM